MSHSAVGRGKAASIAAFPLPTGRPAGEQDCRYLSKTVRSLCRAARGQWSKTRGAKMVVAAAAAINFLKRSCVSVVKDASVMGCHTKGLHLL